MYNPDALHYKIVWPVRTPPVYYGFWNDEAWLNYALSFRPIDYTGGEFDKEAWQDYIVQKNLEKFRAFWPNQDINYIGPDQYKMTAKEV